MKLHHPGFIAAAVTVALASPCLATVTPSFALPSSPILVQPPETTQVTVSAVIDPLSSISAVELCLEVTAPFEISGFQWAGWPPGQVYPMVVYPGPGDGIVFPTPQTVMADLTFPSPAVMPSGPIAAVYITAPAGTPVGTTGTMTTDGPTLGPSSINGDATGQATANLQIVPEPCTASLLVLAVGAMYRRRGST